MRDPATRIDPKVEAAIEETRRLLECYLRFDYWKADPDSSARDVWAQRNPGQLSDRSKNSAIQALFEQTKKRGGKPTRHYRDNALYVAAENLVAQG
jgi:hypothetical protein